MQTLNAKEYLKQYRKLKFIINTRKQQLEELHGLLDVRSTDYSTERVQTSPSDIMSAVIARAIDLERQLEDDLQRAIDCQNEITGLINSLEDSRFQFILTEKYINNQTWENIASEMFMSVRWVQKLHGYALQEVRKILQKN